MLNDTRLCSYLRRFLETEFSHENLDFYKAVLAYKKNPSIDRCNAIVSTYVRAYAPQQINIDAETREEACQKAKEVEESGKVDLSMFDTALETIMTLLYQQSFPRFVRSEYYDEYLRALGEGSPAELHADTNPDVLLAWTLRNRKDKRAKQFHSFLRSVCAEENLLFWWACEDMFTAKDKLESVVLSGGQVVTKLHVRAERIFQQYMKEDAPHWVNLDEHHRKSMENDLRTGIIGTGFRAAQDAAFVLMVNDVFLRFLQSENPFPARNDEPERASQHSPEARPLSTLRNLPRNRSDRGMSASNLLRQSSNGHYKRRWSLSAKSAKRKDGLDVDMGSSAEIFVGGPGTIRTSTGSIATGIGEPNLCAVLGPATSSASSEAVRHEMECLSDNDHSPSSSGGHTSLRNMEDTSPEAMLQLVEQLTQRLAGVERERDQLKFALAQQRQEGGRELARLRQENLNLQMENAELKARMRETEHKSPTHSEKLEPDVVVLGEEDEREDK
eukprot:comp23863_c0_seq1/m.41781 comp23863_c0_seq1/g.41781  ORF comp23863_c0_seq1/g.41781 comp23863_c0_seq1/m.41781 type:complete len:501 (-) comp23863_c0_seq1:61-1563(-)